MKCFECGAEVGGRVICPECRAYVSQEMASFKEMYLSAKRREEFYMTVCIAGYRSKTVSVRGTAVISNTPEHNGVTVTRTVDGKDVVTKIDGCDQFFSHKEPITIGLQDNELKIIDAAGGCSVNGRRVPPGTAISEGDVVSISPVSYFRADFSLDRPAMKQGILSLIPDGVAVDERYLFRRGDNRFFDGTVPSCGSCLSVALDSAPGKKECTSINRMVLGADYLGFVMRAKK